jgi:hypothetical protein
MNTDHSESQSSSSSLSSHMPQGKRLPLLGNRSLVGKIPVKLLDWIILLASLLILGTFAYFILKR